MFPTIPTVGAGQVLLNNQLNTTSPRSTANLSGLTAPAGTLIIAIFVAYQSTGTGNAVWSGFTNGFTEFVDQSSSTTLAIGAAYKWSGGSETGVVSATLATTITGDASMVLLAIPGAHASTPPEAGAKVDGTSAAADPASLSPSWGASDTLWVSVVGSGMTAIASTWDATGTTAPANYVNRVDTNASDTSTIGDCEAAVAFRQLNTASEDVGTAGVDLGNARNSAIVIAVKPAPAIVTGTSVSDLGFTAPAVGGPPAGPYVDEFTALNPVLYLRHGEPSGTTVNDSSTNNLDGTYSGTYTLGVTSGLGDGDTAVSFAKSGSGKAEIPHHLDLNFGLGAGNAWSIVFRYRQDAYTAVSYPGVATKGTTFTGWGMYANDAMVFKANGVDMPTSASAVTTGVWAHWVATYDGSNLRWYKNGALHTTFAYSTTYTPSDTGVLTLNFLDEYADATLDEFGIVRAVLTPSQISILNAAQTVAPEPSDAVVMSPTVAPSRPVRSWR